MTLGGLEESGWIEELKQVVTLQTLTRDLCPGRQLVGPNQISQMLPFSPTTLSLRTVVS